MSSWSAPVRYAECDQQNVVFNSHYLTWCDEAMAGYCRERDLLHLAETVHLVTSTITWRSPARWGDVVDVAVSCPRVGRTSFELVFTIRVGERSCATVTTVYVNTDGAGTPVAVPEPARSRLR